ncbi:MAG: LptA/OstA family protein, partial [Brevinematales bacterium]
QRFISKGVISGGLFVIVALFAQISDPIQITAERSVFQWEIQRLVLEGKVKQVPTIQQNASILKANTIVYEDQKKVGYAFGNVSFQDAQRGVVLLAGEGTYDTRKKEVTATKSPRLYLKKDNVEVSGNTIRFLPEKNDMFVYQNVKIKGKGYLLQGDQAQLYQSANRLFVQGNASLEQDDTTILSRTMQVFYGNGKISSYTASDDVSVTEKKKGYVITGGRLDYYQELAYTRITRDPQIHFTNESGAARVCCLVIDMYQNEERANLLGNVQIIKGNQKVTARWGQYYMKQKRIILTGNPVLENGNSRFEATIMIFDVDKQELVLEGKGKGKLSGQ